jgi:hypothetical protein
VKKEIEEKQEEDSRYDDNVSRKSLSYMSDFQRSDSE